MRTENRDRCAARTEIDRLVDTHDRLIEKRIKSTSSERNAVELVSSSADEKQY